ncbi:MAG: hypothetical protein PHQ86_07675 [Dehalococcoidales bacterium]|nr:hypothetical protein [Dehalococcoidales bacterium]
MDNTIKVWHKSKKRWLKEHEYVLAMSVETDDIAVYRAYCEEQGGTEEWESSVDFEDEITEDVEVLRAISIKDKNGIKLYSSDIIQNGETQYIIQWSKWTASWEAWDFKAWAKGFYDAYIPLHEIDGVGGGNCEPPCYPYPQFYNAIKVGNIYDTPELCPEILDNDEVKP